MEKSRRQFLKYLAAIHFFILGFFFSFNLTKGFKFGKVKTSFAGTPKAHAKSGSSCNYDRDSKFSSEDLYFNEDGTRFYPSFTPIPNLCIACKHYNDYAFQGMMCKIARADHRVGSTFLCDDYVTRSC